MQGDFTVFFHHQHYFALLPLFLLLLLLFFLLLFSCSSSSYFYFFSFASTCSCSVIRGLLSAIAARANALRSLRTFSFDKWSLAIRFVCFLSLRATRPLSFVRYDAIVETKERSDNNASARAGSCYTLRLMRTCDSGIAGVSETMTAEMRWKNITISRPKLADVYCVSK